MEQGSDLPGEGQARISTTVLLTAAGEGDPTARDRLLERYDPFLRSRVRTHLGPGRFRNEGEDLLQNLRTEVVRSLPNVRERSGIAFRSWLNKVVRTRILDWEKARRGSRKNPRSPHLRLWTTFAGQVESRSPTPSRILMNKEQRLRLQRAIDHVPARYQEVLRFILEEEPSPQEVSQFVGKKPEAARKFVQRALEHLRKVLKTKE